MTAKVTLIYALADPETGAIRYVGKTEKAPARRLAIHVAAARRPGAKRRSLAWIASLLAEGVEPRMIHLEMVPAGGNWAAAERRWIAELRANGCDLTNLAEGGEGAAGYRWSAEQLAAKRVLRGPDHHQFGKPMTVAARIALAEVQRAKLNDAEWRAWSSRRRHSGFTPETRQRATEALLQAALDPQVKARRSASIKQTLAQPEIKRKIGEASKATWAANRAKIVAAQNAGKDEEWKAKQAAAKRAQWADPVQRQKFLDAQAKARARRLQLPTPIGE